MKWRLQTWEKQGEFTRWVNGPEASYIKEAIELRDAAIKAGKKARLVPVRRDPIRTIHHIR